VGTDGLAIGVALCAAGIAAALVVAFPPRPARAGAMIVGREVGTGGAVRAWVHPQPASNTATPRITLPTRTPTEGPVATATSARATIPSAPVTVAPGVTAAATAAGTIGPRPPDGPPAPGRPDRPPGSTSAIGTANPAPPGDDTGLPGDATGPPAATGDAPIDLATPVGAGSGLDGDDAYGQAGDGAGGGDPPSSASAADAGGPAGLVRVPVPDPHLRSIWAAYGSPRRGQGWVARFTEGRPGPWGYAWFYLALVGTYGYVVWRLWRAMRGVG